jgi:vacuolar-type H+-ATPase subunit D/Vma8
MGSVRLTCGLPFIQNNENKQTALSTGVRITAVALGTIATTIGILVLLHMPGLNVLGNIGGGVLVGLGAGAAILGAAIKGVKEETKNTIIANVPKTLDTPPTQGQPVTESNPPVITTTQSPEKQDAVQEKEVEPQAKTETIEETSHTKLTKLFDRQYEINARLMQLPNESAKKDSIAAFEHRIIPPLKKELKALEDKLQETDGAEITRRNTYQQEISAKNTQIQEAKNSLQKTTEELKNLQQTRATLNTELDTIEQQINALNRF